MGVKCWQSLLSKWYPRGYNPVLKSDPPKRKSGEFLGGDCHHDVGNFKQCLKQAESGYNNLRISIESEHLIGSAKK